MSNLHSPERQPGESQAKYRERRAASHKAVDAMRCADIGNQRREPSSRERQRDSARRAGRGPRATYGLGLLQPQRLRNQERMAKLHPLRDEHGAYTLIGALIRTEEGVTRRKWLAGISAQRGY